MIPEIKAPHTFSVVSMLLETSDRERQEINLDLNSIHQAINAHAGPDPFSQAVFLWYTKFCPATRDRHANLSNTINDFKDKLCRLLCSPIVLGNAPFDDDVYLGSDGYTYGKKALLVSLSEQRRGEGERFRSPMQPHVERPFEVEEHHLAKFMVAWIKRKNINFSTCYEVDRKYHDLLLQGRLAALPFPRRNDARAPTPTEVVNERMRQIRERNLHIGQRRERQQQQIREDLDASFGGLYDEIRASFDAPQNILNEGLQNSIQRIENIREDLQVQTANAQHNLQDVGEGMVVLIETNQVIYREIDRQHEMIVQHSQETQNEIDQTQEETREILRTSLIDQNMIHALQAEIEEARQVNERLNRQIEQIQVAREREVILNRQVSSALSQEMADQLNEDREHLNDRLQQLPGPIQEQLHPVMTEFQELRSQHIMTLQRLEQIDGETRIAALRGAIDDARHENEVLNSHIDQIERTIVNQTIENHRVESQIREAADQENYTAHLQNLVGQLRLLPDPLRVIFAPVERRMAETFLKEEALVSDVEEKTKDILDNLQKAVIKGALVNIEREIIEIEKENNKLKANNSLLDEKIHQTELTNAQIKINLNEVEKAIKKARKAQLQGLLKAVVVGGCCAAVTGGISYIIEEAARVSLTPAIGGGPMLNIGLAF